MGFAAKRIDCRGEVAVSLPPDEAFPLFTALGELLWVPGWQPEFVHPGSGELELDQVWLTRTGEEVTHWLVTALDREERKVEYGRITPGSRLGKVIVEVAPAAEGSVARVRYVMTGLTPAGNAVLEELESGYPAMMEKWAELIAAYLARRGAS